MISLLCLLAVAGGASALPDWFALRMTSVDDSKVVAHDAQSGVAVSYGADRGGDRMLKRLRKSPRLLRRLSGKSGAFRWELLDLTDPSADAKALARDLGETPSPGSWQAALLEAYSPPPACDHELRYFIRKGTELPVVFRAAPCNADQRARFQLLVEAYMAGSSPTEVLEREAFGKTGMVSAADDVWLGSTPGVADVLARIGIPDDVWPRYPDGFTLLYWGDPNRDRRVAIEFGLDRRVARVRSLSWSASAP